MQKKVIVGLSGGVDSAAAALLLKNEGFDLLGVTLKLFEKKGLSLDKNNACCNENDIKDAEDICKNLGIPHKVLDFGKSFKENVIDYFISSYKNGETPNPCVVCNRTVKFEELFREADRNGNALAATGHYARIGESNGRYYIMKGKDVSKDQSYVLYGLSQNFLSRTVFPLGCFSKSEIRELAKEAGIAVSGKKDSQDICFIPDGNYREFIEDYTGTKFKTGDFVLRDGTVIGTHSGIIGYTVGQRKGLGIASTEPYYVLSKNTETNTVTLGREQELYSKTFTVKNVNFMAIEKLESSIKLKIKTRYRQQEKSATVSPTDENTVRVEFGEAQKAITPGQSAVFYDGDVVVGGGIIV